MTTMSMTGKLEAYSGHAPTDSVPCAIFVILLCMTLLGGPWLLV